MKIKINLSDKEKHILLWIFGRILSAITLIVGMYAIAYFQNVGVITNEVILLPSICIIWLSWYFISKAIFKVYH